MAYPDEYIIIKFEKNEDEPAHPELEHLRRYTVLRAKTYGDGSPHSIAEEPRG
jgi:hypothetical protein